MYLWVPDGSTVGQTGRIEGDHYETVNEYLVKVYDRPMGERYDRLVGYREFHNKIVEIRGVKVDKTARRVWVNGKEVQFTSKEFDLLTFLMEHPNRVFSKEELFENVWNMESYGDIATVTVHIKKIREKIEFDSAKPQYIETIWGVGYRFKI